MHVQWPRGGAPGAKSAPTPTDTTEKAGGAMAGTKVSAGTQQECLPRPPAGSRAGRHLRKVLWLPRISPTRRLVPQAVVPTGLRSREHHQCTSDPLAALPSCPAHDAKKSKTLINLSQKVTHSLPSPHCCQFPQSQSRPRPLAHCLPARCAMLAGPWPSLCHVTHWLID